MRNDAQWLSCEVDCSAGCSICTRRRTEPVFHAPRSLLARACLPFGRRDVDDHPPRRQARLAEQRHAVSLTDRLRLAGDVERPVQPAGSEQREGLLTVAVVSLHPRIVIGVPDEHSGEVPKLFIVRKDPALTEADILRHCHDQLTGYKRPKYVEFRSELPKTNVGKILRRALRDEKKAA